MGHGATASACGMPSLPMRMGRHAIDLGVCTRGLGGGGYCSAQRWGGWLYLDWHILVTCMCHIQRCMLAGSSNVHAAPLGAFDGMFGNGVCDACIIKFASASVF